MSITFWLSFIFTAHTNNACTTHGTPLFEMRELSERDKPAIATKIYESGAWTITKDGQLDDRGCFDRKELRAMRSALEHASWKTTTSPIACFAYDPDFTEYRLHGKLRFTERMCSGKTADFETMQAIDLVKKDLREEQEPTQPAPPAPPPVATVPTLPSPTPLPPPATVPPFSKPPVTLPPPARPPVDECRVHGTPLFEIRHKSDMAAPTSTIAIYSTGAWTLQPIDKDGHLGALSTGCFAKSTTQSLREVINQSPWDTSFLRIVCRAYSPSYTEYYVHGQLEYTARMCGAQKLDEKSLGAIKIIEGELAKVMPKPAA